MEHKLDRYDCKPMHRTCGKCDLYSYALSRCKAGKVNPRTLKDTISAMRVMGSSYICDYSKWKTKARQALVKSQSQEDENGSTRS